MRPVAVADGVTLGLPSHVDGAVTLKATDGGIDPSVFEAAEALQLFVGPSADCCEGRVPMAGRYARQGDTVTFTPAFAFVSGQTYTARVLSAPGSPALVPFTIARETPSVAAVVTDIFPSGDVLPENVLRFYIHFSVPMAPHVAFDHIELRTAAGVLDDAAFMKFKQELWNEDRTRLTVLVDPGRIKRAVATNTALGPALQAGHRYRLTVVGGWFSADGTSALSEFSKVFAVSEALRERPDVGTWQVRPARVGTREALEVRFDRPFDRHLLTAGIRVVTADGREVDGTVQLDHECVWRFTPREAWGEEVRIVADAALEDVAGNNFRDLLDAVASDASQPPRTQRPVPLLRGTGRP